MAGVLGGDAVPNRWRSFPVTARPSRLWKPAQASGFIADAVDAIPAIFGRLILVAGMEKEPEGTYRSPLLEVLVGPDVLDSLLHSVHADLVIHWLSLGLDRQVEDLLVYLREFENRGPELAQAIASMSDYSDLLPANVRDMYRNHFFMEMKRVAVLARARLQG